MSANELESLKARAKAMNIKHHPNIGLEKLKTLLNGLLDPEPEDTVVAPTGVPKETRAQRTMRLRKDAHKLVRVIISCRHPDKTEWEGETFTASNSAVGSITKYVPFNNEEGWHVPQIILNMIRERECSVFQWKKTAGGNKIKKGKQIKEFSVTVLPALTGEELQELKEQQALARSID
jgi:hypothetical protein